MVLPQDLRNLHLCINPVNWEQGLQEISAHSCSQTHYSQQAKDGSSSSAHGRMNKQIQFEHRVEYYSALKRKEILTHATAWINLEVTMLREISQSQEDK